MDDLTIFKHLYKQLEHDLRKLEETLKTKRLKTEAENLSLFRKKPVNKKAYCREQDKPRTNFDK